jgi:uncharacterized protein
MIAPSARLGKPVRGSSTEDAMPATDERDPFERGIAYFNAREFFKAHEAWEELWLHAPAAEKPFLQGIIQIAAGFHHFARGNPRGASSLLAAGIRKISHYPGAHRGIDVARLQREAQAWIDGLQGQAGESRQWPQVHRIR